MYDHFDLYFEGIKLLPKNALLGISGGEPTLLKKNLFIFLEKVFPSQSLSTIFILGQLGFVYDCSS